MVAKSEKDVMALALASDWWARQCEASDWGRVREEEGRHGKGQTSARCGRHKEEASVRVRGRVGVWWSKGGGRGRCSGLVHEDGRSKGKNEGSGGVIPAAELHHFA
jgi:hypothetical protein